MPAKSPRKKPEELIPTIWFTQKFWFPISLTSISSSAPFLWLPSCYAGLLAILSMGQAGSCPRTSVFCFSPSLEYCLFISIWELDHKKSWGLKNWCFQNCATGEDSCESLIKPVNPKGSQPWIFIGRTEAEAEAPILWAPDAKTWLTGKDPDAGKDWGQELKGVTEDEMVGWHHWLNEHKFEQTAGDSEGQGSLVCYSPWGRKESDMT